MLELNDITLSLEEAYNKVAGHLKYSFHRFATIFMARKSAHLKYAEIDGSLLILSIPPAGTAPYSYYSLFPQGGGDILKITDILLKEFGEVNYFALMPDMVQTLEQAMPGKFEITPVRDDYDYIYETEALISLQGKKYHSKRNHISRFTKTYNCEFVELDEHSVAACIPILNEWFGMHPGYKTPIFDEKQAILELMHNFKELDLKGGAIVIDGAVCAFSIGELIAPDTAHIIIEKADTHYDGIYPVINREFLANVWKETTYVNREEDMGIEGLRKSKLSYRPVGFNEVCNATYKK